MPGTGTAPYPDASHHPVGGTPLFHYTLELSRDPPRLRAVVPTSPHFCLRTCRITTTSPAQVQGLRCTLARTREQGFSPLCRCTGSPRFRRFRDSSSGPCPCRPILFFTELHCSTGGLDRRGNTPAPIAAAPARLRARGYSDSRDWQSRPKVTWQVTGVGAPLISSERSPVGGQVCVVLSVWLNGIDRWRGHRLITAVLKAKRNNSTPAGEVSRQAAHRASKNFCASAQFHQPGQQQQQMPGMRECKVKTKGNSGSRSQSRNLFYVTGISLS